MNDKTIYLNNPLHGLKLEILLNELIEHYGWEILAEYTNLNCFKIKPSVDSSIKFLKKTDWAREKLERFYLYEYKNLPKANADQFDIPPRDRIIPAHHKPGEPKELLLGQAPIPKTKDQHRHSDKKKYSVDNKNDNVKRASKKSAENKSTDPWANSPK